MMDLTLYKMFAALVLLLLNAVSVQAMVLDSRQTTPTKVCNSTTSICYLETTSKATQPIFRIAIPDTSAAPFDTILQIISPISYGWTGFAWGGAMTLNPLVVAWPNGNKVVVTSRWAT